MPNIVQRVNEQGREVDTHLEPVRTRAYERGVIGIRQPVTPERTRELFSRLSELDQRRWLKQSQNLDQRR
jgi:hypothetical protein